MSDEIYEFYLSIDSIPAFISEIRISIESNGDISRLLEVKEEI